MSQRLGVFQHGCYISVTIEDDGITNVVYLEASEVEELVEALNEGIEAAKKMYN